ncbi:MAG: hypothetical protein AB7U83_08085 [Vicinamibacterales bacterium]
MPPRWAVYLWAAPTTLVGVAASALAAERQVVSGVLEGHGPAIAAAFDRLAPGRRIAAMTLGHVVLGRSAADLERTRRHERIHVRQCERWGPLFVPAYLIASLAAWWRGGDVYADNAFEREAWRDAPLSPRRS